MYLPDRRKDDIIKNLHAVIDAAENSNHAGEVALCEIGAASRMHRALREVLLSWEPRKEHYRNEAEYLKARKVYESARSACRLAEGSEVFA